MLKEIRFGELVDSLKKTEGFKVEKEVIHSSGVYREFILSKGSTKVDIEYLEFANAQTPMKFVVESDKSGPTNFYTIDSFLNHLSIQLGHPA